MHVCRESRQLAPYQKAFVKTFPGESEARYIWVNFHEDMICLEHPYLSTLEPHMADIQRLRLTVPTERREFEHWAENFTRYTEHRFEGFTALREVHMAVSYGMTFWGANGTSYGVCSSENVKFLDLQTGLLLTRPQVDLANDWFDQDGWLVQDMDDIDLDLEVSSDWPFLELCSEIE
jgi:hypothetical protein